MKIQNIKNYQKNNFSGLSADITFNNGKTFNLFFEIESKFKNYTHNDASPFVASLIPICMRIGEDLEIEEGLSREFLDKAKKFEKLLSSWNKDFKHISINAKIYKQTKTNGKKIGCFFSGGVDSYYTYLKNRDKITSLIFVHGFDIKLNDFKLYSRVQKSIKSTTDKQSLELVRIRTNIRPLYDRYLSWGSDHEFALTAVSLFIKNGFDAIYASCGLPRKNMPHIINTPKIYPILSDGSLKLIHYTCNVSKLDKMRLISKSPLALNNLRVCWVNTKDSFNCGKCEKCLRTMLGLYIYDSLEKCKTFNNKLDLTPLRNIRVTKYVLVYFIDILEELKRKNDTKILINQLEEFIKINQSPSYFQKITIQVREKLNYIDKKYNNQRLYWFMSRRGII